MSRGRKRPLAARTFAHAIDQAEHLKLLEGLRAIEPGEGKGSITADARTLIGSVGMDKDCEASYPTHSRWDDVVGVRHSGGDHAFFIEVHPAESSNVSEMIRKLDWLLTFLARERQKALAALPHEFHWVAIGRINIPKHPPQYKPLQTNLRSRGLRGPAKHLAIP